MVTNANSRDRRLNASRSTGILFIRSRLLERGITLDSLSKSLGRSRHGLRMGLRRGTPWAVKVVAEVLGISIRRCRAMLQISSPQPSERLRDRKRARA